MLDLIQTQVLIQDLELHSHFLGSCLIHSEQYVQDNLKKILRAYKWNSTCYGEDYDSVMDMILCNLFPYHKRECKRFYQGRGQPMRKIYSKYQIFAIDLQLRDQLRNMLGGVI